MYARVSFRRVGGARGILLVPATIDGRGPFELLLDTGAGTCLLSASIAHELGLRPTETKEAFGAGGPLEVELSVVPSLAIGPARVENVKVALTEELQKFGDCFGQKVDGVIGYNFLRGFRLSLDYRSRFVTLHRGHVFPATGDRRQATEVGFRLAHPARPLAILPALVDGTGPHPFALDTGASASVVSLRLAEAIGIHPAPTGAVRGAGGVVAASAARLKRLEIGDASVPDLDVILADFLSPLSALVETDIRGIIGQDFLERFAVTIDYPRKLISLLPSSQVSVPRDDIALTPA